MGAETIISLAILGCIALFAFFLHRVRKELEESKKLLVSLSSDLSEVHRSLQGLSVQLPQTAGDMEAKELERRLSNEREEEMRRYLEEDK